ncbi:hypothetical protein OTU49_010976 [Cherax quadricarinatus]|uniref:Zinc finger protein 865 n=1 Tax=Cherax quadricarinatus TaxID=27406 RepID=A0AAW0WCJ5_CHEQU
MKKVIIPANGKSMPPLVMVGPAEAAKSLPTHVQPILLKTFKAPAQASQPKLNTQSMVLKMNPPNSNNASNMCFMQTSVGKKVLLTNVNTSTPSNKVLLVPKTNAPPVISSSAATPPQISPVASANAPCTVVFQPSSSTVASPGIAVPTSQPIMLKVSGLAPLVVQHTPLAPVVSIKHEPGIEDSQMITVISNSTTTPTTTTTVTQPITSISPNSSPFVILKGTTTFKVVGKPVPVKLNPRFQKIAPKAQFFTGPFSQPLHLPILKKVDTTQNVQSSPSTKNGMSSKPPAYLNIQVKDEPQEAASGEAITLDGVHIKEERLDLQSEQEATFPEATEDASGVNSILDVRIKEEPKDEQCELLAKDEQLRQVLEVTNNNIKVTPQPKFFIRTSEGKLVSISPEEAEALGLDHKDKVENNQKKLLNALSSIKNFTFQNTFEQQDLNKKPEAVALIPDDVNVKDYVNCHVPPAAEKTATLMKNLHNKSLRTNAKYVIAPKSNTTIIGEYTVSERRFLRIRIGTERDICDIPITPLNAYQCPFCTRNFKTKDHLISHIRVHTGERPYPCDVCGKRYRQRIDITRHMRIHTGEKPFTCGLCNASFNQKSNLRSHMRIHTGERPVQCRVCGKGFSRNTHLKQHMKLHTGEKPFQCSVCFRPFRFKSGLQAHERIHSGLKPYACSLCGRSFTQIVGLIRHERTHTAEKPFRCQSCGKSFNSRDILKAHVKKHTSERPYTCDLCGKTFTDQAALRCHQKKYHTNMLLCVICLREDFKDRIELREHLRAHERENWEETPEGDLVPIIRHDNSQHIVSIDDTMENLMDSDEDINVVNDVMVKDGAEEIQVEVELDPDDPMESDENTVDEEEEDVSEYEEHELQIEESDPLA